MKNTTELINELGNYHTWIQSLKSINEKLFFTPIKMGKWSPAEIISHITFWDKYILEEILPKMKQGANIVTVEFVVINQPAAKYALSGVSRESLIKEQVESRKNILSALKAKAEEEFFVAFKLNGEEIDEYSGYPHTMFNYFASFVWHDNHHKQQIMEFLSSQHVKL